MKKTYYQLRFTQRSPLRIGSGGGEQTDLDVLRDSRGLPFLPGSAIAGVLRASMPLETGDRLFGTISGERAESRILVGDGTLPAGAAVTLQHRDGVRISDRGAAVPGAKYDFEAVECAEVYTAVLELADAVAPELEAALEQALGVWVRYGVQFGARTTRGYGEMAVSACKKTLDSLPAWLAFDPLAADAFADAAPVAGSDAEGALLHLSTELRMQGSFTVRTAAAPAAEALESEPKQEPLRNAAGLPVIPGTAWAGAFRHHMRSLAAELGTEPQAVDRLFGAVDGEILRSQIRFGETAVADSASYVYTRNAVDRYTGAPRNQALFTERFAYGGHGALEIDLPRDTEPALLRLLAVSLIDLDLGVLSVGGEGSVGRGVCTVTRLTVDGADQTAALKAADCTFLVKGEH